MNQEDLLRCIREVFPDPIWPKNRLVTKDDSRDIDSQYVIDHYQGRRWTELTPEELTWASSDAWAFSKEALLYFFPAWLSLDVNAPGHSWQAKGISYQRSPDLAAYFSSPQRKVVHDALRFVYGGEKSLMDNEENSIHRLFQATSMTMTIRDTPRGRMIIGTIEEVHAHQLDEWRAMTPQDKADLFFELMRFWRPDAPGLDKTAQIVKLA